MPMIGVYAPADAFEDKHLLARRLAAELWGSRACPILRCPVRTPLRSFMKLPADAIAVPNTDLVAAARREPAQTRQTSPTVRAVNNAKGAQA